MAVVQRIVWKGVGLAAGALGKGLLAAIQK